MTCVSSSRGVNTKNVQPLFNESECLKPLLLVVLALIFNDEGPRPIELSCPVKRNTALGDVLFVLARIVDDGHLNIVYTINSGVKSVGHNAAVQARPSEATPGWATMLSSENFSNDLRMLGCDGKQRFRRARWLAATLLPILKGASGNAEHARELGL